MFLVGATSTGQPALQRSPGVRQISSGVRTLLQRRPLSGNFSSDIYEKHDKMNKRSLKKCEICLFSSLFHFFLVSHLLSFFFLFLSLSFSFSLPFFLSSNLHLLSLVLSVVLLLTLKKLYKSNLPHLLLKLQMIQMVLKLQ